VSFSLDCFVKYFQMINIVYLLGPKHSSKIVKKAAEYLRSESVIALPTDTLYGLACLAQHSPAIKKLYQIKARDEAKPVAICVSEVSEVSEWGQVTVSDQLLGQLLPGPVTLVFQRSPLLNPDLNPGNDLVGIRIPDSWFIRQLVDHLRQPLALTSANLSGAQSTLAPEEFGDIWHQLKAVYHGGRIPDSPVARLGSTVVDLSVPGKYKIIRPGCAHQQTVRTLEQHGLENVETNE